jgi:Ricin-type beta-trefoil lectin domain
MPALIMTTALAVLRRQIRPVVVLSATATIACLAATSQVALASAAQPASGPIISGYQSTKCLDDLADSTKNDTPAVIGDCNGSAEQDWTVETDGTIQINGKCLDIYRQQKTNRTPVEIFTCNGGANQQWQEVNGTLVNPVSHKCLDDPRFNTTSGTALILYTCNGGRNQQWDQPSGSAS